MRDVARPAAFAFWTARLGTRCPDPLAFALAAALANSPPRSWKTKLNSTSKGSHSSPTADQLCRAAALAAFAAAVRPTRACFETRHQVSLQSEYLPSQRQEKGQQQADNNHSIDGDIQAQTEDHLEAPARQVLVYKQFRKGAHIQAQTHSMGRQHRCDKEASKI